MIKSLFVLIILSMSFLAFGQPGGEVYSVEPIAFPVYDSIPDASDYFSLDVYKKWTNDTSILYEKVVYESMGLKVMAYVARPSKVPATKKSPVIIFNRGGYIRNNMAIDYLSFFHSMVAKGYMVVAPALRESEGGEGKDEVGGKDLADIWNVLPYIKSKDYTDLRNLFMLGESRGGMMTLMLMKAGFPLQAAAVYGATTDFGLYMEGNERVQALAYKVWPDYESNKESIYRKRSAVEWADQIDAPLLIMAGSADRTIDPHHSLNLASRLNEYGKEYQLIILNGGNHSLNGKDEERRDKEISDWFKGRMR